MYTWKNNKDRLALMFDGKEVCVLRVVGTTFYIEACLDRGCQDAKLTATTFASAKEEAVRWFAAQLQKSNETHKACIAANEQMLAQIAPEKKQKSLESMDTLKQRDKLLEEKWLELEDVPVNPETEKLEAPFMHFPIGTDKEDILHWFDERHSKGIVHLLYHEGIDHYPELEKLFHRHACCFNCDSETCALNPEGICLHPILYGTVPEYVDDVGCKGWISKEE